MVTATYICPHCQQANEVGMGGEILEATPGRDDNATARIVPDTVH